MCLGGSNDATKEAEQAEAQRRAQVKATQQQIESVYSSPERQADITSLEGAVRQFLGQDLSRKTGEAQRGLKFALARSGQTLGSTAVDQNRDLGEQYLRGSLEVDRRAQAAGAALRDADQQSKLSLFSQAAAGLDQTTAVRQAGEGLRANIGIARGDALQTGLGDLFSAFGDIYKRSKEAKGTRDAEKYQYGGQYYTPNQYYAGYGGGQ